MNLMMLRQKMFKFLLSIISLLLFQVNAAEPPNDPATHRSDSAQASSSSSTGDQQRTDIPQKVAPILEDLKYLLRLGMFATFDDKLKILRLYNGKELVAAIPCEFYIREIFVTTNDIVVLGSHKLLSNRSIVYSTSQVFKGEGFSRISRVQELKDGRLVVMGESQSQKKVFIQQADGSWQELKLKELPKIDRVQELKDGRLLAIGPDFQGQGKIFIEQSNGNWIELSTEGLQEIDSVQVLNDGRLLVSEYNSGKRRIFIQQADGGWREINIEGLSEILNFQKLKDDRLLVWGDSQGQVKIFLQQVDGSWEDIKVEGLRVLTKDI